MNKSKDPNNNPTHQALGASPRRARAATTTAVEIAVALAMMSFTGCITVDIPPASGDFFAGAFIISGTMELDRDEQTCSIFHGDNGVEYSLFQGPRLTNEEFDQLFEDGARARLELDIRSDLELRCSPNPTVEVIEILEFIPG